MAICAAVLAGLLTLVLMFRVFFHGLDDFQECLDLTFSSMASGVLADWGEELEALLKFGAWAGSAWLAGWGVYAGLKALFG